jgi:7-carboxy-7-deazaguanine synthase
MKISSINRVLEGEGIRAGIPMLLIRTAGCNMKTSCRGCDQPDALTALNAKEYSVQDIVDMLRKEEGLDWVSFTGGEPLLYEKEISQIVDLFWTINYQINTNGAMPVPKWVNEYGDDDTHWVVDWKTPGSGAKSTHINDWIRLLRRNSMSIFTVKFVVHNEADLTFILEQSKTKEFEYVRENIIVSPVVQSIRENILGGTHIGPDQTDWNRRVWQFCLENKLRFSLQMHKVVWGQDRQDV